MKKIFRKLGALISAAARRKAGPAANDAMGSTTGALLNSAVRLAGLGCWSWDFPKGEITLTAEAQRIFGETAAVVIPFSAWLQAVDPADASKLQQIEDDVHNGRRSFSFEYRFTTPGGVQKWLKSDGEVVSSDDEGTPLTLAGTVIDLGERLGLERQGDRLQGPPGDALNTAYTWSWEQDASYRFTLLEGGPRIPVPELVGAVGLRRWELPFAVPLNCTWQEHIESLELRQPLRGFEYRIGQEPGASYVSTVADPVFDATGAFLGYRGIAHDITERARAEQAATQSRLLLQHASRLGQVGAWALRLPEMQAEWTDESRLLLGASRKAQLSWEEALAQLEERFRTAVRQAVADCGALGTGFILEGRASTRQGTTKWLRITGEPEPTITGSCRRVIGAIQDISARKNDARRLQELNERLVTTLESITQGFYTLDRDWRFSYVNHETERVAKLSRDELLGASIFELFPWFAGSRFELEFQRALFEGHAVHFEALLDALGTWVEVHAYPSPQGLAVYFVDITERKNAQEALRASEERHRLLFELSLDAILQVEHVSGKILYANPAACRMFGLTEAQFRERGRDTLLAPQEQRGKRMLEEVDRAGRGGGYLTLVRQDGSEFEAELSGAIFTASDGVSYASVVIRDISERLKYQAEILALNEGLAHKVRERTTELEAANAELKAFAQSLAHDLRTPIAAINALAHVLEQRLQTTSERECKYATRIRQAAEQLDEYVAALLSHARISQTPMQQSRVDLSAMAQAILADLRVREPWRNVAMHVQPGLSAVGDRTLLRMALDNLLGNAWKFTGDRDGAEIRFSAAQEADGSTTFCVSDNGAGFDMEYADKLFGAFQRLHTQAEFPGTGIGLANVQRIISRHGGRIWAVSRKDDGASFYFTLPQERDDLENLRPTPT
jgi:PAS domain S-box-containing protein